MSTAHKLSMADRLLRYSAAASVLTAGGLLTGTQAALADSVIVAEPQHYLVNPGFDYYPIDFDQDTTPEFVVRLAWTTVSSTVGWIDLISFAQSAAFMAVPGGYSMYVLALEAGDPIDASQAWLQPVNYASLTDKGIGGYWLDLVDSRYVGVRYVGSADSQYHYGWLELSVIDRTPGPPSVIVHRYGHNTTAGDPILASVDVAGVSTASGMQAVAAGAFAALGGALTWIRRKLRK